MPKETISYGVPIRLGDPDKGNGIDTFTPHLHVRWHREGEWVQVQLTVEPEHARYLLDNTCRDITSEVLDRRAINNLIRTLRRARDAAYGTDE